MPESDRDSAVNVSRTSGDKDTPSEKVTVDVCGRFSALK